MGGLEIKSVTTQKQPHTAVGNTTYSPTNPGNRRIKSKTAQNFKQQLNCKTQAKTALRQLYSFNHPEIQGG